MMGSTSDATGCSSGEANPQHADDDKAADYVSRPIVSAPESLINAQGKFHFGCFNTPVRTANMMDIESHCCCGLLRTPRWLKYVQLREWQAFQIKNDEYFCLVALYNAKKICLVQCIVFNFKTQTKYKYEKKVPNALSVVVPNSLYGNTHGYYHSNNFSIDVVHDLDTHKLDLRVQIQQFDASLPDVSVHLSGMHNTTQYQPMVVCNPFSSIDSAMYSHKCLMPCEGTVTLNHSHRSLSIDTQEVIYFARDRSALIIDDHKGFYPYVTRYDWVTSLGYLPVPSNESPPLSARGEKSLQKDIPLSVVEKIHENGQPNDLSMNSAVPPLAECSAPSEQSIAVTVSSIAVPLPSGVTSTTPKTQLVGFNLTHNQVSQPDLFNENCLWVNGVLHPLPPVTVERAQGPEGVWTIRDTFDRVNIRFTPSTQTSVNINLLFLHSKYEGPYGMFHGFLRKSDGEKVVIDGMIGMGEDFFLRV